MKLIFDCPFCGGEPDVDQSVGADGRHHCTIVCYCGGTYERAFAQGTSTNPVDATKVAVYDWELRDGKLPEYDYLVDLGILSYLVDSNPEPTSFNGCMMVVIGDRVIDYENQLIASFSR